MRKAFFPGAGLGTRMGTWTQDSPKPLLKVHDIPLIYYSLFWAKSWGVENGIVNTHYLADQLESELKYFTDFPLHISREEPEILGTGGGIRTGLEKFWNIDDEFLVLNPDFIFFPEKDFSPWPSEEERQKFDCILYLAHSPSDKTYTGLSLLEGKVSFEAGGFFYIGLSWMRGTPLSTIRPNTPFDLADTFRELSKSGRLGGKIFSGDFLDLGEKEYYEKYKDIDFSNRLPKEWEAYSDKIRNRG